MNLARRSKELPETAEEFLKKTRMEVESEGLKLSVTVGGKEGKSKAEFCGGLWRRNSKNAVK